MEGDRVETNWHWLISIVKHCMGIVFLIAVCFNSSFAQDEGTTVITEPNSGTVRFDYTTPSGYSNGYIYFCYSINASLTPPQGSCYDINGPRFYTLNGLSDGDVIRYYYKVNMSPELVTSVESHIVGQSLISQWDLTVNSTTGGSASPSGTQTLDSGVTQALTATANSGYHFTGWTITSGTLTSDNLSSTTVNISMHAGDATIRANFEEDLVLTVVSDGGGVVTPAGANVVVANANTTLTATPSYGYIFDRWTVTNGSVSYFSNYTSTAPTVRLSTSSATVQANFTKMDTLTLSNDGNGSTVPTSSIVGQRGSTYNISANPNSGYQFKEWQIISGNSTLSDLQLRNSQVTFNGDTEVRAIFEEIPMHKVTTSIGDGLGTVTPDSTEMREGSLYTILRATPNDVGWSFDHWEYDTASVDYINSGTDATPTIRVTDSTEFKAFFARHYTPCSFPFHDGFENGIMKDCWMRWGASGAASPIVSSTFSVQGNYAMRMYTTSSSRLNESILTVDLSGQSNVLFEYWQDESGMLINNLLPDSIHTSDHLNGNGVSVSADSGQTWYTVAHYDYRQPYVMNRIDLDSVMNHHGLSYSADVQFKFSQYSGSYDYLYFDEVRIYTPQNYNLKTELIGGGTILSPSVSDTTLYELDSVFVKAIPDSGYRFSHWETMSGDVHYLDSLQDSTLIRLYSDVVLRAHFVAQYQVTTQSDGNGVITPVYTNTAVDSGFVMNATVNPEPGYAFSHWETISGVVTYTDSLHSDSSITLHSNAVLQANFVKVYSTCGFPFYDGFEADTLQSCWMKWGMDTTRAFVLPFKNLPWAHRDSSSLRMYITTSNRLNEAILSIDLEGQSNVYLEYWQDEFSMTTGNQLTTGMHVSDHVSGNGVSMSVDSGNTWYTIATYFYAQPYRQKIINLDSVLAQYGLSYSKDVQVKFSQYAFSSDNLYFDDVRVFSPDSHTLATQIQGGGLIQSPTSSSVSVYELDSTVVHAVPDSGYRFSHWETVSGIVNYQDSLQDSTKIQISSDAVIKAHFIAQYKLTTQIDGDGNVTPMYLDSIVDSAHVITPTITLEPGYVFSDWETVSGTVVYGDSLLANTTMIVHSNAIVKANFAKTYSSCNLPFFDGFESNALQNCWIHWGAEQARSFALPLNSASLAYEGNYSLRMHTSSSNRLNEFILSVDLANDSNVYLEYWQDEVGMTTSNVLPDSLHALDHLNGNGISLSVDSGNTWYTINHYDYGQPYQFNRISLDSVVHHHSLNYSENVQIKFSQYVFSNDYLYLDNVKVYEPEPFTLQTQVDGSGQVIKPSTVDTILTEIDTTEIIARADSGHIFTKWVTVSGDVWYKDSLSMSTDIHITSNATIEAHFEPTSQLTVSHVGIGVTIPSAGIHTVFKDSTISLEATPGRVHKFSKWEVVNGLISIANLNEMNTSSTISGDGEIRATFELKDIYDLTTSDTTHYNFITHGDTSLAGALDGVYFRVVGTGDPLEITVTERTGSNWNKQIHFIGQDSLTSSYSVSAIDSTATLTTWTPTLTLGQVYYLKVNTNDSLSLNHNWSIKYRVVGKIYVRTQYDILRKDTTLYRAVGEDFNITVTPINGFSFDHWETLDGKVTYLNSTTPNDFFAELRADSMPIVLNAVFKLDSNASPKIDISSIEYSTYPQICVDFAVFDTTLQLVYNNLDTTNFTLWEDGVELEYELSVENFYSEHRMVLVVDESGSMGATKMALAQGALRDFISSKRTTDSLAIVAFESTTRLIHGLSDDETSLLSSVSRLSSGGGTTINAGVNRGIDQLLNKDEYKSIIVFSDGSTNASDLNLTDGVIQRANENGITIFSIGLVDNTLQPLYDLADATGGFYSWVNNVDSLSSVFQKIRAQIYSQYEICYQTPDSAWGDGVIEHEVIIQTDIDIKSARDTAYWDENNMPPEIVLTQPTLDLMGQNNPVNVSLRIAALITDDSSRVKAANLFYRTVGDTTYNYVNLIQNGNEYYFDLPVGDVLSPGIEFYITAIDEFNLVGRSPGKDPELNPHYIPVGNATPEIIIDVADCYNQNQEFNFNILATDSNGIGHFMIHYREVGDVFYTTDTLVGSGSQYPVTLPVSVTSGQQLEYYLELVDQLGFVTRDPVVDHYSITSCGSLLLAPIALMLPSLDPLDTLFQDSVYIRLHSPSDSAISDLEIYYITDSTHTLDLTSPHVISGDSVKIDQTSYFRMFSHHPDPQYLDSDTSTANFYKQYKLTTPFLEKIDNLNFSDSIFADSLKLIIRTADSLVKDLRIFFTTDSTIPDSTRYWEANDTVTVYDTTHFVYFTEAPLLFNSDTVYSNYYPADTTTDPWMTIAGNIVVDTTYFQDSVCYALHNNPPVNHVHYSHNSSVNFTDSISVGDSLCISQTTTVYAYSEIEDHIQSAIIQRELIRYDTTDAPVITPAGHIFDSNYVEVRILETTPGSKIYYTLDGSIPDSTSTLYNYDASSRDVIYITDTITVTAIAYMDDKKYLESPVVSETYFPLEKSEDPWMTIDSLIIADTAYFLDSTCYVLDNGVPKTDIFYSYISSVGLTDSIAAGDTLCVNQTTTVWAYAITELFGKSNIIQRELIRYDTTSAPVITPAGHKFDSAYVEVRIFETMPGSKIYYTLDGSIPDTTSTLYNYDASSRDVIYITDTITVTAIAYMDDKKYIESSIVSETYIPLEKSVEPWMTIDSLIITDTAYFLDSTCYVLDNGVPKTNIFYSYTSPASLTDSAAAGDTLCVNQTVTVWAYAITEEFGKSTIIQRELIRYDTTTAPTIKPKGHTFDSAYVVVTIHEDMPGSKIYYTLDGSVPDSNSLAYTYSDVSRDTLKITTTTTVSAIAYHEDKIYLESPIVSETYTKEWLPLDVVILNQTGDTLATWINGMDSLYREMNNLDSLYQIISRHNHTDLTELGWDISTKNLLDSLSVTIMRTKESSLEYIHSDSLRYLLFNESVALEPDEIEANFYDTLVIKHQGIDSISFQIPIRPIVRPSDLIVADSVNAIRSDTLIRLGTEKLFIKVMDQPGHKDSTYTTRVVSKSRFGNHSSDTLFVKLERDSLTIRERVEFGDTYTASFDLNTNPYNSQIDALDLVPGDTIEVLYVDPIDKDSSLAILIYGSVQEITGVLQLFNEDKEDMKALSIIDGRNDSLFLHLIDDNLFGHKDTVLAQIYSQEIKGLLSDSLQIELVYNTDSLYWEGLIVLKNSDQFQIDDSLLNWYKHALIDIKVPSHDLTGKVVDTLSLSKEIKYENVDAELVVADGKDSASTIDRLSSSVFIKIKDQSFSDLVDSLFVDVECLHTGDKEDKQLLVESATQSGEYFIENALSKSELQPYTSENGVIQCFYNDTLVVHYTDPVYGDVVSDTTIINAYFETIFADINFITKDDTAKVITEVYNIMSDSLKVRSHFISLTVSLADTITARVVNDQGDSLEIQLVETGAYTGVYDGYLPFEFIGDSHQYNDGKLTSKLDYSLLDNVSNITASLIVLDSARANLIAYASSRKLLSAKMHDGDRSGQGDSVLMKFSGNLSHPPESIAELYWNKVDADHSIFVEPSMVNFLLRSDNSIDSSTIVIDLLTIQDEIKGTDIPETDTPYVQLPLNNFFGGQVAELQDGVSPLLLSAMKNPSVRKSSDEFSGQGFAADTLMFMFSEPVKMRTQENLSAIWNKQFRYSANCDLESKAIQFQSVIPADTLGLSFKVLINSNTPEVGGCISVVESYKLIMDKFNNPIALTSILVNGVNRKSKTHLTILNRLAGIKEGHDKEMWIKPGTDVEIPVSENQSVLAIQSRERYSIRVTIISSEGQFVNQLNSSFGYKDEFQQYIRRTEAGILNYIPWNLRDINGRLVGSGVYFWKVEIHFESGANESYLLKSGVKGRKRAF